MKPTVQAKEWSEEFYTFVSALQVSNFSPGVQQKFREFIHSLLRQQEDELVERIEKMKQVCSYPKNVYPKCPSCSALDDVLSVLRKKGKI
jgi:hypothetical protein